MSEEITRAASPRQLKLFHLENPLTLRFGNDFFRSLPEGPGVYFFHSSVGRLLSGIQSFSGSTGAPKRLPPAPQKNHVDAVIAGIGLGGREPFVFVSSNATFLQGSRW